MYHQSLSDKAIINGFRYVVLDALKWYRREATMAEPKMASMPSEAMPMPDAMAYEDMNFSISDIMEQKRLQRHTLTNGQRTTPEFITSLEPNEIFVFGSNLKGMHGGGEDERRESLADAQVEHGELLRQIFAMIHRCLDRQKSDILCAYYGLQTKRQSVERLAMRYGVTTKRIMHIVRDAEEKMRYSDDAIEIWKYLHRK